MYNYTLALKGAGIVIKNNVGIERKVMWIEAGTIQAKLAQVINTICSKCGSSYKYLSYGLSAEIRQKMCHELDKKTLQMKAVSSGRTVCFNTRILFRCMWIQTG